MTEKIIGRVDVVYNEALIERMAAIIHARTYADVDNDDAGTAWEDVCLLGKIIYINTARACFREMLGTFFA